MNHIIKGFGVSFQKVRLWALLKTWVLYLLESVHRSTSIDFAENQLFPSLIGLSPLSIVHPILLPQKWVRSSKKLSFFFNLTMDRSLGFGSNSINTAFYWLNFFLPPLISLSMLIPIDSLTHYPKGTLLVSLMKPWIDCHHRGSVQPLCDCAPFRTPIAFLSKVRLGRLGFHKSAFPFPHGTLRYWSWIYI